MPAGPPDSNTPSSVGDRPNAWPVAGVV
jgi:hypothetical protein